MMTLFIRELERFMDKYTAQPFNHEDEEAVTAYWLEVDKAMLSWWHKYDNKPHCKIYQTMILSAFDALELLWKEKE